MTNQMEHMYVRMLTAEISDWDGRGVDVQRSVDECLAEHPGASLEGATILVPMGRVVLAVNGRDYDLGNIRARIDLGRPDTGYDFVVELMETEDFTPLNWPRKEGVPIHPCAEEHGTLCLGVGYWPCCNARRQGRYGDMVSVVKSVVNTYSMSGYYNIRCWDRELYHFECDECAFLEWSTDKEESLCERCKNPSGD